MEKPSSKTIEITVLSAESLFVNKKQRLKKESYITVKADPYNVRSTKPNPKGGSCPTWNEKFVMDLPVHARFITVEARSGSRLIGSAHVPVSDFAGRHLPENYLSFLSYRLRDGHGDKNGIVNLSAKVVSGGGDGGCAASCSRPWMAVPVAGVGGGGGVVTGIPVKYGC